MRATSAARAGTAPRSVSQGRAPASRRGTVVAPTASAAPRRSGVEHAGSGATIRRAIVGGIVVAALLIVGLVGFLVLSYTPLFTISSIDAEATEHISSDNIAKLANVQSGTTLLSLDEEQVTKNLQKNPWVDSVSFEREFPDRLRISVTERTVDSIVVMSAGNVAWCLGDGNVWIEPLSLSPGENESFSEAALRKAQEMGALLITDVPSTVSPVAGSVATDETLKAVEAYREQFGPGLSSQIVSYNASTLDSISCTLSSGVEVSLGAATSIEAKESVITEILAKYSGKVTYINVRVPSKPSYRMVNSDNVQQGSGTAGTEYS